MIGVRYFFDQALEPLHFVHRLPESREGQPVPEADIAEHHIADMEADAIADLRQVLLLRRCSLSWVMRATAIVRGGERLAAGDLAMGRDGGRRE